MALKRVSLCSFYLTPSSSFSDSVRVLVLLVSLFSASLLLVHCTTDASDVQAIQVLYTSLGSPSQLTNWKTDGGDPCGESWKGITCQGSAVVSIQISGLRLSGTMGYLLSNLLSLRTL
uniref:Protein STRUBBELIG-RECEPTOR FAMILY 8-like n=1 Tax=Rhizophora mucronata TaxID=61149 RepID=A0A2P2KHD2_RHIMU